MYLIAFTKEEYKKIVRPWLENLRPETYVTYWPEEPSIMLSNPADASYVKLLTNGSIVKTKLDKMIENEES